MKFWRLSTDNTVIREKYAYIFLRETTINRGCWKGIILHLFRIILSPRLLPK